MTKEYTYDIIVPIATKDVFILKKNIQFIQCNLKNHNNIYIITHKKNFKIISSYLKEKNCYLINEEEILGGLSFKNLLKYTTPRNLQFVNGWYYQQFLKLGFALSKYANEYYLSWDADTIPLREIHFFKSKHPLFTMKKEFHHAYFDSIKNLLHIEKIEPESFIAEHMLFKTSIVKELINTISHSAIQGENWIQKIINSLDLSDSPLAFSEFETYGTYCMNYYPDLYKTRHLNTFRSGGLIAGRFISNKKLRNISFDTDTISLELKDFPIFPLNIIHYFYCKWLNLFSKILH